MKKSLLFVPVLLAGLLASCGNEPGPGPVNPDHKHQFETAWTNDADYHWHKATCGHDVIDGKEAHYDDNTDGKCDVCNYVISSSEIHVESVSLNKKALNLYEGEGSTLTYTIDPSNADNKNVTWESSNSIVASVENGVVKAWNAGTADISVITKDGNKKDTCKVTVNKKIPEKTLIKDEFALNSQGYDFSQKSLVNDPLDYMSYNLAFAVGGNTYNNQPTLIKATNKHYEARVYWGNTMTITSSTNTLVKIEFDLGENDKGNSMTCSVGEIIDGAWVGEAKEIVFTIAGTGGYKAFETFRFCYEGQSEDDPEVVTNLGEKTISEVKQYITEHPVKKNSFGNGVSEFKYVTISGYVLACIDTVKSTSKFGLDVTLPAKVIIGDETGIIAVATGTGQGTIWDKAKDYRCEKTTKYKVTGYISEILGNPELKVISYEWDQTLDIDWSIDVWKEETVSLEQFYDRVCDTNYNCGGSGYGGVYQIKGLYCYNAESQNQHLRFYNLTDGTLNLRINAYNMPMLSMGNVYDITGIISLKDYSPIIVPFEITENTTAETTFDYKDVAIKLTASELNEIHGPQDDTSTKQPDAIKAFSKIYCIDTTDDTEAETLSVDNYKLFYECGYNYPPVVYFAMKQFNFSGGGKGSWQITLVPDCVFEYNE